MNIGIITFHWAVNYGAILQSYALQTYLQKKGHNTSIINYVPIGHKKDLIRSVLNPFRAKIELKKYFKDKKLEKFRSKFLNLTSEYNTLESLKLSPPEMDVYICGSDQVWNPYFLMKGEHGSYSPTYFLDFGDDKVMRLGYAVSFGCEKYPEIESKEASKYINRFAGIGVRENSGKQIVKELGYHKDAVVVPDPTLLISKEDYSKLLNKNQEKLNNQAFVYFLRNEEDEVKDILDVISKEYNIKLNKESNKQTDDINEWITNFANSELIFTNSFHGVVFSLIFQKPFFVYLAKGKSSGMNDRFKTLLTNVGLLNRIVNSPDDINNKQNIEINWNDVNSKISELREVTDRYFSNYLK